MFEVIIGGVLIAICIIFISLFFKVIPEVISAILKAIKELIDFKK